MSQHTRHTNTIGFGLVTLALIATACQRPASEDSASSTKGIGMEVATGLEVKQPYVNMKGVDTTDKRRPLYIYYAANQIGDFFMTAAVLRDLDNLQRSCQAGLDVVALINTNVHDPRYQPAGASAPVPHYLACAAQGSRLQRVPLPAAVVAKIKAITDPNLPVSQRLGVPVGPNGDEYWSLYSQSAPLVHPEVMKTLLTDIVFTTYPAQKWTYFLQIKGHGSASNNDPTGYSSLLLSAMTPQRLREKVELGFVSSNSGRQIPAQISTLLTSRLQNGGAMFASIAEVKLYFDCLSRGLNGDARYARSGLCLNVAKAAIKKLAAARVASRSGLGNTGLGDAGLGDAGLGDAGLGDAGLGDAGLGDAGLGDAGLGDFGLGDFGLGEEGLSSLTYMGLSVKDFDAMVLPLFTGNRDLAFAYFESCHNGFGRSDEQQADLHKAIANGINLAMFFSPTGSLNWNSVRLFDWIRSKPLTTSGLQNALVDGVQKDVVSYD